MSAKVTLPESVPFKGKAYRNIYTIKESQDLFDDLVADPASIPTLQVWDNESSGIDHSAPQPQRVFQYGDTSTVDVIIDPAKWYSGRFSDGTFGVWYGALEEDTSIREALFHAYQFFKADVKATNKPVIIERKMFSAELDANSCVDLHSLGMRDELISPDYSFCQELGKEAVETSVDMFLTPSARREGGICTPVFSAECITSDEALYFFRFTILADSEVRITKDSDELVEIPSEWQN